MYTTDYLFSLTYIRTKLERDFSCIGAAEVEAELPFNRPRHPIFRTHFSRSGSIPHERTNERTYPLTQRSINSFSHISCPNTHIPHHPQLHPSSFSPPMASLQRSPAIKVLKSFQLLFLIPPVLFLSCFSGSQFCVFAQGSKVLMVGRGNRVRAA